MMELNIDYDNVGKPTRVDMRAREVARHEIVLPTDQNGSFLINGNVLDLGQHRGDQVEINKAFCR